MDRIVGLVLLRVLLPIGFLTAIIGWIAFGAEENRFIASGLSLVAAAFSGWGGYCQVRYRVTPVRNGFLTPGYHWAAKDDRPIRYWSTTILFVVGSLVCLVFSVVVLVFSTAVLR